MLKKNPQFTTKTTVINTNPQYKQEKVVDGAVDLTAAVNEHYPPVINTNRYYIKEPDLVDLALSSIKIQAGVVQDQIVIVPRSL